jgi:hypothetical protein
MKYQHFQERVMRPHSFSAVVLLCALGCGGPQFAPVSGVVKLNGKPLAHAIVTFQPIVEKGGVAPNGSTGKTNDMGEYTLTGSGGELGAVVGKHKVRITAADNQATGDSDARPSKTAAPPKEKVPENYNTKTTLEVTVTATDNKHNFDLGGAAAPPTSKASGGDARR